MPLDAGWVTDLLAMSMMTGQSGQWSHPERRNEEHVAALSRRQQQQQQQQRHKKPHERARKRPHVSDFEYLDEVAVADR